MKHKLVNKVVKRLENYHKKGFTSILVNFDISDHVLKERIANSNRNTAVLRTASTFEEVLTRQVNETNKEDIVASLEGEANHLFRIENSDDIQFVIRNIVEIAQSVDPSSIRRFVNHEK